jgi:hypothetical protein
MLDEDFFGRLGPAKGLGLGVVGGEEVVDGLLQSSGTARFRADDQVEWDFLASAMRLF